MAGDRPLRILVVHNLYRSEGGPSGENQVVDDEVAMLRAAGMRVETYFRSSDEIRSFGLLARAEMAVRPIYSRADVCGVGTVLGAFEPDIVHLHNPYPLISPWIVRTAKARGIPVVQSVHNHRHVCVQGAFFRDGQPCEDCSGRTVPWPAVLHGCYHGSRPQSVVMATTLTVHRPTWRSIDRFLPVSEYTADHLVRAGLPREKIVVKPNSVADPGGVKPLGEGFLFVGRLARDKGVSLALDAWERSGLGSKSRLVVAGDGEERGLVESAAQRMAGLEYVGRVDQRRVGELLDQCAIAIIPSLCAETFGRFAVEAFAHGRAVVASDLGGLADVVSDDCGWRVPPSADAFARRMVAAVEGGEAERKGLAARTRFESLYTNDRVLGILEGTYRALTERGPYDCERSAVA